MNAPCSGAPLTAPHVTTEGLYRWKAINKVGRHVGLDFYDLLIEGDYATDLLPDEIAIYHQLSRFQGHRSKAVDARSRPYPDSWHLQREIACAK